MPKSHSRKSGSTSARWAYPARLLVSRARCNGLVSTSANECPCRKPRSLDARSRPRGVSGISVRPVCAPERLHSVSPCLTIQTCCDTITPRIDSPCPAPCECAEGSAAYLQASAAAMRCVHRWFWMTLRFDIPTHSAAIPHEGQPFHAVQSDIGAAGVLCWQGSMRHQPFEPLLYRNRPRHFRTGRGELRHVCPAGVRALRCAREVR